MSIWSSLSQSRSRMWLILSAEMVASVPSSLRSIVYLILRSLSPSFVFIFLASFYVGGPITSRLRNLPLRVGLLWVSDISPFKFRLYCILLDYSAFGVILSLFLAFAGYTLVVLPFSLFFSIRAFTILIGAFTHFLKIWYFSNICSRNRLSPPFLWVGLSSKIEGVSSVSQIDNVINILGS